MLSRSIAAAVVILATTLPAAAGVRMGEAAARAGFESLTPAQRKAVQGVMREAGTYRSGLDGAWGPATGRGALEAAQMLEYNSYERLDFELDTPKEARRFFLFMLSDSAPAYLWGEGGECDGPDC